MILFLFSSNLVLQILCRVYIKKKNFLKIESGMLLGTPTHLPNKQLLTTVGGGGCPGFKIFQVNKPSYSIGISHELKEMILSPFPLAWFSSNRY